AAQCRACMADVPARARRRRLPLLRKRTPRRQRLFPARQWPGGWLSPGVVHRHRGVLRRDPLLSRQWRRPPGTHRLAALTPVEADLGRQAPPRIPVGANRWLARPPVDADLGRQPRLAFRWVPTVGWHALR